MARFLAWRLADAIPTVLLVLTLVFVAMRILPGDPALAALGDNALPEQLVALREKMGLNLPLWQQYVNFLVGVLTLDFGRSLINNTPVLQLLAHHLPYTIELTLVAMVMGIVAGIPLGVLAATHRNKLPDAGVRLFSLIGYAIPDFYLGALLLIAFSLNLGWFPVNGGGTDFASRMHHIVLPRPHARLREGCLHRKADPHLAPRGVRARLHSHRSRQGRTRDAGNLPPRAAQRAAPALHRSRPQPARNSVRVGGG
jgi:peptide/nickel transport system permease protein